MQTLEPAATPEASGSRAVAPLAAGAVLGAATLYVGLVTPGSGRTIPCPLQATTGLWCPGCGLTRAVHHLLRGDLLGAVSYNVFVPLVVVGVAIGWWSWFAGRAWARPVQWPSRVAPRWWIGLFTVFIAYGVLRNFPAFRLLAP